MSGYPVRIAKNGYPVVVDNVEDIIGETKTLLHGSSAFGSLQQLSQRQAWAIGAFTGALISNKIYRSCPNGSSGIIFVFSNTYKNGTGEDPVPNTIFVKLSIETLSGSIIPISFGGLSVGAIKSGGMLASDPISGDVDFGSAFYECNTVSSLLPPNVRINGLGAGGALTAGTYFYRVTALFGLEESNGSTVVSATVSGSTSSVFLEWSDTNFDGVEVTGYNIYKGTASGSEILIDSVSGMVRKYYDVRDTNTVSTTVTTTLVSPGSFTLTLASTIGLKQGDRINVAGVGQRTIKTVISGTQVYLTALITAVSSGTVITFNNLVPSLTQVIPANIQQSKMYPNEGKRINQDLTYSRNGSSYINAQGDGMFSAVAVLGNIRDDLFTLKPAIILWGDSIEKGTGDVDSSVDYRGFAARALNNQYPYIDASVGGETISIATNRIFCNRRHILAQHAKGLISDYGTNDLGTDLNVLKSNLIKFHRDAIKDGVRWTRQTTIIPKTVSSDGWQTASNQTVLASEADRVNLNTWLRAPASAGAGNSFLFDLGDSYRNFAKVWDTAALVEVNASNVITLNGGRILTYPATPLVTKVGTTSGSVSFLNDTGLSMTPAQWEGYMLAATTGGITSYGQIIANTATSFTLEPSLTNAVTIGTTYYVYKGSSKDGTHPTNFIHAIMATALPVQSEFI